MALSVLISVLTFLGADGLRLLDALCLGLGLGATEWGREGVRTGALNSGSGSVSLILFQGRIRGILNCSNR